MNRNYHDIISRIPEKPIWFDENAVPRYCEFHLDHLDIYASECCLLLIQCQACKHEFKVALSQDRYLDLYPDNLPLSTKILNRYIAYGDPPNIGCCESGPSMTSEPIKVLEYWKKDSGEWIRDSKFEIEVHEEDY